MINLGWHMEEEGKNMGHKMYDIHMHIVPGVDDGSWNLDMSSSMLYMAYQQGIQKIIATPHSSAYDQNYESTIAAFQELKEQSKWKWLGVELYLGCEVNCNSRNIENVLEKLQAGIYPSLNQTAYVLTEFSTRISPNEAIVCIEKLLNAGWIPIIAHVERYKQLCADEVCLQQLKKSGCLFQVNIYSMFDEGNEVVKQNALKLIEQKLVDFLGTDAHRMNYRPPSAEDGLKFLYSYFDKDYVDKIAFGNAEEMLLI